MTDDFWIAWIERLLFTLPIVVGAGVLGILQRAPQPRLSNAALTVAAAGAIAIRLGVPVALWLDARRIDVGGYPWEPNRWLYAAVALVVSAPLTALVYLYRRYRRVPRSPPGGLWLYLVVVAFVVGIAALVTGAVAFAVTFVAGAPAGRLVAVASGVLAGIVAGSFPVGIYRDAVYVRTHSDRWRPNPALYLGLAFGSLLVGILQPIVAGYYLLRRRSAL